MAIKTKLNIKDKYNKSKKAIKLRGSNNYS